MKTNSGIVRAFWELFDGAQFEEAAQLMRNDAVVRWCNTREIFRGRDKFILANKVYPARWHITLEKISACEDEVISVVRVESDELGVSFYATSFFLINDGLISEINEYWGDNGEPPAWRLEQGLSERY